MNSVAVKLIPIIGVTISVAVAGVIMNFSIILIEMPILKMGYWFFERSKNPTAGGHTLLLD